MSDVSKTEYLFTRFFVFLNQRKRRSAPDPELQVVRLSAGNNVRVGCRHRRDSSFEICAWSVRRCGTGGSLVKPRGLVAGAVFGLRSGQRGRGIVRRLAGVVGLAGLGASGGNVLARA